jgi:hypothetical protein
MALLINSASQHTLRLLCAALWGALMYTKPTNQTADEWAAWVERNIGGAK